MDALLPPVALAAALLGCWLSGRAWAAARRLALEMVHLRQRLARLEEAGAGARAMGGGAAAPEARALGGRLDLLEGELAALRARASHAAAPAPAGRAAAAGDPPAADLRERLSRAGYGGVTLVEEGADGAWLVEAEREGILVKGWVRAAPEGGVEVRGVSSVRAFP